MRTSKKTFSECPQVIFLHIGWAREYKGAVDDPPLGKFGYFVEGGETAGESFNFYCFRKRCYGYAPFYKVNMSKLGAVSDADHVDDILVIWTATDPSGQGRYIVGWYKNARVYAKMDDRRPNEARPEAITVAASKDCHVVPEDERTFYVPSMVKGWPGIASGFYASNTLSQKELDKVLAYVDGQSSNGFYLDETDSQKKLVIGGGGRQNQDPAERALVEKAAIDFVTTHYRALQWNVTSVESDNVGWDLNVCRGGRTLKVEVKGLSGEGRVELTPGEYKAMLAYKNRMSYRLAVVWNARSINPTLTIFEYIPARKAWITEDGRTLTIEEKTGAIVHF
ncbi:DUF3883 domain-containing protein [Gluconobacter cerinus]|uniref:Protein NO VEIN C-terminal domain-containing protein n=1 Tax=Gluconobacter cerinus TaxID=38307 RepID=A0A1B6VJP9_9PROT|nr:DUF3883 domain-containing protein [Gluconobacter cerinus]OAJ67436.1 hypothetical protein A0123_02035 [Gluconobacter cerinus]